MALSAEPAHAGLTSSEREQVRQYVATAQPGNAARVRALVARTDLTTDEAIASLREALVPVAFNDARAAFVRELLFGGASAASRPALAPVVVRGLLARADAVYAKAGADLETKPDALAELTRIYAFIDVAIANAGKPQALAHDLSAGIPDASYDECARALSDHIAARPTLLRSQATLDVPMTRVRAQAQLALLDLTGDSPTRRIELAERLGLVGARKALMTEVGLLVLDASRADDTRVARLRGLLDRLPAARAGVAAFFFGDERATFRSRGTVMVLKSALEGSSNAASNAVVAWPEDVDPGPIDVGMVDLTLELSNLAVRRTLAARDDLRARADADARDSAGDSAKTVGAPRDASTEATLTAAVAVVALDGARAIDLAAVRFFSGKKETAAILSDALGVLAWSGGASVGGAGATGLALQVGRATGVTGPGATEPVTNVRLAPNGGVLGFKLDGHTWEIAREDAGRVSAMKRDGQPVTLSSLASARIPVTDGVTWQEGKLVFARLQGNPRAGIAPGPRIRVVGTNAKGFDAIATPAPSPNVVVEADLRIENDLGGLVVRTMSDRDALRGVSLLIAPSSPPRALLLASDGSGNETEVAPSVALPDTKAFHVKITTRGSSIEAVVAGVTMKGSIPLPLAGGDVAIRAKKGGGVEVTGFTVSRAK